MFHKVLFFLALVSCSFSLNPSARLSISQEGIIKIKNSLLPEVLTKIVNIPIPDIQEKGDLYSLDIKNLQITNFNLPNDHLMITLQNDKVQVDLDNLAFEADGDLTLKILSTINGKIKVSLSQTTVIMDLALFLDDNAKLQVSVSNANVNVVNMNIKLEGGFEIKIINWIIGLVSGKIKSSVQQQVQSALQTQLPSAINQILIGLVDEIPLNLFGKNYNLTYTFLQPSINSERLSLPIFAYLYYKNKTEPLADPKPFSESSSNRSVSASISDFLINSILQSLHNSDSLWLVITTIPSINQMILAEDLEFFIPGLVEKYGPKRKIAFICDSIEAPKIGFLQNLYDITVDGTFSCQIQPVDPYPKTIGSLDLNLSLSLQLNIDENKMVQVNFTKADINEITIKNLTHNQDNLNALKDVVEMMLRFGLKAVDLKQKIPEISKVSIENLLTLYTEGSVQVDADLNFEKLLSKSKKALHSVLYLNQENLNEIKENINSDN